MKNEEKENCINQNESKLSEAEIFEEIMDKKIPVKNLAIYAESSYTAASIASAYYTDDTEELNKKGYDAAKRIIADFCFNGDESAADGFIDIISWIYRKNGEAMLAEESMYDEEIPF